VEYGGLRVLDLESLRTSLFLDASPAMAKREKYG